MVQNLQPLCNLFLFIFLTCKMLETKSKAPFLYLFCCSKKVEVVTKSYTRTSGLPSHPENSFLLCEDIHTSSRGK